MFFALRTLWYERRRFLPAVFAIAFSGMLMALQVGLLFGLIGVVAVPIENSTADVWVMHTQTPACDLARPIPRYWIERVWSQPEVVTADGTTETRTVTTGLANDQVTEVVSGVEGSGTVLIPSTTTQQPRIGGFGGKLGVEAIRR